MKKLVVLLFCLADAFCLSAQPPATFVRYTVDDGLPQNSIWQLFQDKRGFMWSATSDGLARFDGQRFHVYKHQIGNKNSLSSTGFTKMIEDRYGYLWIGTGSGIDRYDPFTDNFTPIYSHGAGNIHVPIEGSKSDEMWVWVNSKGFAVLDLITGKLRRFIPVDSVNSELAVDNCLQVEKDSHGNIWIIAERAGLLCWNPATNKCETILHGIKLHARHMAFHLETDTLWIGAAETTNTLSCIDLKNKKVLHSVSILTANGDVLHATAMLRNSSGWILASLNGGVVLYNSDFSSELHNTYRNLNSGVQWYTLLVDRSGILWAGSDGAGVHKQNGAMKAFYTLRRPDTQPYMVKNIFTSDSLTYTCIYKNGIDVFTKGGTYLKTLQTGSNGAGNFQFVSANSRDDNEHYWLMGDSCFGRFNTTDHSFTNYLDSVRTKFPDASVVPHYSALLKTDDQTLYAAFGNQLLTLRNAGGPLKTELVYNFEGNNISALAELPSGKLAVGTFHGLWMKDESSGKWVQQNIIGDLQIKSLCVDAAGKLWVGTISGLFKIDLQQNTADLFDEADGLPNSFIYGIVKDGTGMLWFSHNRGISKVDCGNLNFVHYNITHGLQSNEFNTGAYHSSKDGRVFFGGVNGTNYFLPDEIKVRPQTPGVSLSSIRLFDEPLPGDSAAWSRKSLLLTYDQNTLSFDFTSSDYASPELNQFSWKMEGVDEKWSGATNQSYCRYPNMEPGHYRLLVKSSNCDGVWSEPSELLSIYIAPPWWTTWWFLTLLFTSATLCIAGFTYYIFLLQRKRHLREIHTQERIHSERERISRDLHDNVGAQLTLILSQIEWLRKSDKHSADSQLPLDELSTTAKDTIRKLRESIWAVQKETIPIDEFADKFKSYALDQIRYMPEVQISFRENFEDLTSLTPEITLNIFSICQEALTNALKHSASSEIIVNFSSGPHCVFLFEISDNGIGYDPDQKSDGNGLRNMRHRAAEAGAEITITSAPGKGTKIQLLITGKK